MSPNKMVFPPIPNATGDTFLEYHETSHRLIVCHSANSGTGKGLMHCTVPFKLPLHTCIPLLLAACTNETWFLESSGQPQPISFSMPSSCANTVFRVSQHFHGGLPVYTSSHPQPSLLRFNAGGRYWEMCSLHERRVLAVSAAHSI